METGLDTISAGSRRGLETSPGKESVKGDTVGSQTPEPSLSWETETWPALSGPSGTWGGAVRAHTNGGHHQGATENEVLVPTAPPCSGLVCEVLSSPSKGAFKQSLEK